MEEIGIKDVLEMTGIMLKSIRVPVELVEDIGVPLSRAVANLQACVDALSQGSTAEETAAETAKAEEGTEDV